jgi:hypothetical protein
VGGFFSSCCIYCGTFYGCFTNWSVFWSGIYWGYCIYWGCIYWGYFTNWSTFWNTLTLFN